MTEVQLFVDVFGDSTTLDDDFARMGQHLWSRGLTISPGGDDFFWVAVPVAGGVKLKTMQKPRCQYNRI